ncbi:MAG: BTAD domain-containing putative transcriptional regulator, partial [Caldilinea sp.]
MFESYLDNANQASEAEAEIAHLERAVALYRGDLLPGNYSDWLLAERERLAQAYGEALDRLASLHEERCDYGRAIGCVRALLRHDPLTEPAYARLMRLYALNNDRAAALHVFHTCVTVLRRELDVEPDHATQALYEQLLNPAPATVAPRIESVTPLVGRRSEWIQLQDAWRKARHRPQLALISGEAGIGKTRLAEALAEWVERQGAPVLIAHCHAAGGDLAYAPVTTWLRHRPPPPLANGWLRELARLLPELLAEHPGLSPPAPLTEAWQRLHLFEAVAHALLNNRTSLLLVLDDIQWCDRETLDWLMHLLHFRSPQPSQHPQLMVVATARNEDVTPKAAFSGWKATLVRTNQPLELKLEPLDQDATAQLAQHITSQSINPQQMHLLYRESEGIPLFVVEMVRAGFAATPDATPSLPDRVRYTLEARRAQRCAQARAGGERAAGIGREVTYEVLAPTA